MRGDVTTEEVAAALQLSVGLFRRRLRQTGIPGDELSMPESAALSRLDREGPQTSADLARSEQISAQSMGATLASLGSRGLVERRPDTVDGRRTLISMTTSGKRALRQRRSARAAQITAALQQDFTRDELRALLAAAPLIERLAQRL